MTPYYSDEWITIYNGDCRDVLPELSGIETCITDPPYGLAFMGKDWDHGVPGVEFWRLVFGALLPGASCLAFGGTRTHHRLMCAIEDAGFELRDCLMWLYGSGFPKSFDLSKGIDGLDAPDAMMADPLDFTAWLRTTGITRQQIRDATGTTMDSHYLTAASQPAVPTGVHWAAMRPLIEGEIPEWVDAMIGEPGRACENMARREVLGTKLGTDTKQSIPGFSTAKYGGTGATVEIPITAPATDAAKQWDGWGTALKPAWEPIVMAMKPLVGTFARNGLRHGVAGLNIDGARVGTDGGTRGTNYAKTGLLGVGGRCDIEQLDAGRWPANVVLDEDAARQLDEQSGVSESVRSMRGNRAGVNTNFGGADGLRGHLDVGGASRFFYTAKASASDRGENNDHPTVKPSDLMKWLSVLTKTPTAGTVLDPFMGSGTTIFAAKETGRRAIGIELDERYCEVAASRCAQGVLDLVGA